MSYIEINAEGTRFFYGAGSDLFSQLPLPTQLPRLEVITKVLDSGAARLVIFPNMLNQNKGVCYFLYWSDARLLSELDDKVLAGTYQDDDFEMSVKTQFQVTECVKCRHRWDTLVIPPGDPYFGAPGLIDRKISKSKFLTCPACRSSLRQLVVLILAPSE